VCGRFDSWAEVLELHGEVIVAKLGCIVEERLDGTLKVRSVADLRRNHCNDFVEGCERIVLPRLKDYVDDADALCQASQPGGKVAILVANFVDAFRIFVAHEA
jgi:hypothetical protein